MAAFYQPFFSMATFKRNEVRERRGVKSKGKKIDTIRIADDNAASALVEILGEYWNSKKIWMTPGYKITFHGHRRNETVSRIH